MKFRRFLISLSIVTALLALSISDVKACTCSFVGPPCEEYWQSQAVFAGKVIKKSTFYVEEGEGDSRYRYQRMLVRFSIEQAFKGIVGDEVEIVTGMGGGDCGYHFEDGERYVVYAIRDGRDKSRLYSGICLPQTESLLTNANLGETISERAGRTISHEIAPIADVRSTEHYRRAVAGNALAKILRRLM